MSEPTTAAARLPDPMKPEKRPREGWPMERTARDTAAGLRPTVCRLNRCGRPLGIGTHLTITGHGRASDQTIPVCEDHWQALRDIHPLEV